MLHMSQDVRVDEEQATERRARLLTLPYINTSEIHYKQLYKIIPNSELYNLRVIPLEVVKGSITFGITNTTAQQTMKMLRMRLHDSSVRFALISDVGFREYMKLYDPPEKVVYQDIDISSSSTSQLFNEVSETLTHVRSDDVLAYLVQQAYRLKASDIHLENRADTK